MEAPGSRAADPGEPYVRFRAAVERDFPRTRQIEDYARDLGYSARTLSRAMLAVDGLTAKQFVDRRLLLEVERLLAHSDHSAARIAARLGFSKVTHFCGRETGRCPTRGGEFRVEHGGVGTESRIDADGRPGSQECEPAVRQAVESDADDVAGVALPDR